MTEQGLAAAATVVDAISKDPAMLAARRARRAERLRAHLTTTGIAVLAAIAVLRFHRPPVALTPKPFQALFAAVPAPDAYGRSGELRMRFAMPGDTVQFPLAIQGDPAAIAYSWEPVNAGVTVEASRPLAGGRFTVPEAPGFYRLVLLKAGVRHEVPEVALAVMVPFAEKDGGVLDGYRLGFYRGERSGAVAGGRARTRTSGSSGVPDGFVKVDVNASALRLSKHFHVRDFLTHDGQQQWPRFAAVQPRLIDKLELVIADVALSHGVDPDSVQVHVNVNAGFRSPVYNRTVDRAAKDSRHQYGDAADVAIDANFDGRFSREDSRLVAEAVERVERANPDLAGGMGLYLSSRYSHSYVHIDARGRRARWRG